MKKKTVFLASAIIFIAAMLSCVSAYAYELPENAYWGAEYSTSCKHSFSKTYSYPASCNYNGYDEYTCSKCNSYYFVPTTKPHSYKKKVVKAKASNSSGIGTEGYSYYQCKNCGCYREDGYKYFSYPSRYVLSKTSYTYNGKAKKPSVTVYDAEGKKISSSNYTVSYSDNVKVGRATVKIVFKNKYKGTVKEHFRIKPKKATISSAKYKSKGKMVVKWKKNTSASGYILQYSTSSKFSKRSTCTVIVSKNSTTSKAITDLPARKYYVRVAAYKTVSSEKYRGKWSEVKSTSIKKGVGLKAMINHTKTDLSGRDEIKSLTYNGVDIKKYNTTYDRIKAIYDWHSRNNTKYFADCMQCNISFNNCVYALYGEHRSYDVFIWLAAGNFKNNDGSVVMHKWSVLSFQGVSYIFDPRLQGYTADKTGATYFGVPKSSPTSKKYLLDGYMFYWESEKYSTIV